jgi:hypothetical protein
MCGKCLKGVRANWSHAYRFNISVQVAKVVNSLCSFQHLETCEYMLFVSPETHSGSATYNCMHGSRWTHKCKRHDIDAVRTEL